MWVLSAIEVRGVQQANFSSQPEWTHENHRSACLQ